MQAKLSTASFFENHPEYYPEFVNPAFYTETERRPSNGIWGTLIRFQIAGIIILLCLVEIMLLRPTLKQREVVAERIAELRKEVTKQKALLARRVREAELLRTDPEYVEIIARDKLDLMRPGETIIRLEPTHRKGGTPTVVNQPVSAPKPIAPR